MKRKKKSFFLPVILAAGLLLGACNNTPTPVNPPVVETTYTVSFNANGGTGTMASVSDVSGEYTLPECTFTAPTGKHFVGWKVNNQGNLLQPGAKVTISADTQIVAQWELTTYTVSFVANGGSGEMAAVANIVGAYTLPACSFTAPEGKRFVGWKVNGEGETKAVGASINVETNVQLVAQWELIKYTVSFKANGGTGEMAAVADQLGEYTLPENGFAAPEGKHFAGWKVNGQGDMLQPGAKIQVTANVEIVAQWEITTYTVSFVAGDGTGEMAAVSSVVGEYTLPECTFVAPTGYHFGGWKVGGLGDALQPGAKITVNANTNLVAHWELTKYTVSFAAGDGTGEMNPVTEQLGEYVLPANAFTAPEGKHFVGWKVGGEGETLATGATINVTADVRIVAQWGINVYTVVYKNGDTVLQTEQVSHGAKVPAYAGETPTKAADTDAVKYRFIGWDKDLEAAITANTEINAKFAAYAKEIEVDGFENYKNDAALSKGGWAAIGYHTDTQIWDEDTPATVSLGNNGISGAKSLRFDAWENKVGYKIRKTFAAGEFSYVANALQFSLKTPSINQVKINLVVRIPVTDANTKETKMMDVPFGYAFQPTSSEYVTYTIPFNDAKWGAWDEDGKTIKLLAESQGMSEDDILSAITMFEIYMVGDDGGSNRPYIAFLDDVKFITMETPENKQVEAMGQYTVYTGISASQDTIKLTLGAAGAATAKILTQKNQPEISGKIAVSGKEVTFTSADEGATLVYKGELVNGGQSIKGKSATGAIKNDVGPMDMMAVQTIDNFDQYKEDGVSWHVIDKNTGETNEMSDRSGCRGAYYSEFYKQGREATFGGQDWSLMEGDGSQLKLKTDGGHSGNNYLCIKSSQWNAMRYMQFGLIDGTSEQNSFRGNKLSFWAKTNGLVPQFKVSLYYQTAPRNSTKDNYVSSFTFTEAAAVGAWKHYEIELNPDVVYYGFLVFMEKHTSTADSFLYIDDVEVYGEASPYAEYIEPNIKMSKNFVYTATVNGLFNAQLSIVDEDDLVLYCPGLGVNSLSGKYSTTSEDIEIVLPGDVTYTATVSQDGKTLTCKSVVGDGAIATALNGLNFNMISYADNAESYDGDGKMYYQGNTDESKISGARGAYHCDYYTGGSSNLSPIGGNGWSLMGGNGDQLQLNKNDSYDGDQSLKMKFSSAGNMRYLQWCLNKGTGDGYSNVTKFGIFIKNPNNYDVPIKLYAYFVKQLTPSNQGDASRTSKEVTIPANSDWTFYSIDLDSAKTYYGYGIYMNYKGNTNYLNVDGALFYNDCMFAAKKDVTLSGELTDGVAASFKFGNPGKVLVTCAALSMNDVECTCRMAMNGSDQYMQVTIGADTVVTGTYTISNTGVVTFTIVSKDGTYKDYIKVGQVFTNAA